ncbi:MAG: hypothetical protein HOI47_04800 [Candidatus Scalindua sp.]|jgi:hypothetical protein|nr:hypothetical protein [Candidatus Scalindua sp.]MBT6225960.1 hypothetical protein [Candidatus Scalindua sp.]
MIDPEQFKILLPLACKWAEQQEESIQQKGNILTSSQINDATHVGVKHPEKVRLLQVPNIPIPDEPSLAVAAQATQLITANTAGLTLRYGIFIRSDCWNDRKLLIHELVHTSQYERLGGILPFLENYLSEVLSIGYPAAPMEQEAIKIAQEMTT